MAKEVATLYKNEFDALCLGGGVMKLACRCVFWNFQVDWDSTMNPIIARVCGCDYCSSQRAEFVSDSSSVVQYETKDESKLKLCSMVTVRHDFHECTNCGLVLVTSNIENQTYCVLNAKTLGLEVHGLDPAIQDYGGESVPERLARRRKRWSRMGAVP